MLAERQRSSLNIHFFHDAIAIEYSTQLISSDVSGMIDSKSVLPRGNDNREIFHFLDKFRSVSQEGELLEKNTDWIYEWSSRPDQVPPKYDKILDLMLNNKFRETSMQEKIVYFFWLFSYNFFLLELNVSNIKKYHCYMLSYP